MMKTIRSADNGVGCRRTGRGMRTVAWPFLSAVSTLVSVDASASNVWTGYKNVQEVQVVEDGGFLIYFTSPIGSPCSSAGTNALYVYVGANFVTADGAKGMLAAALSALATGMKVSVLYDDSTSFCYGRYLRVTQ
jgi:hypothetical protein